MARHTRSPKREHRIDMEVVVDCYTPEERVMGWYCYLEGKLRFPFPARCIAERMVSPLRVGQRVEVVGMAPEEECQCEMFVAIPWEDRRLAVPLAQLKPTTKVDKDTKEAIADWNYWLDQGYMF